MPATDTLAVKKLSLDIKNFRTVPQQDENAAIHPLITLDPDYFWALMDSLIDTGYLPTESIIVLKQGKSLVVKEGNRRIAALKLMHGFAPLDDFDVPKAIKAKVLALTPAWKKSNEKVPCLVYEASEEAAADRVVALTHGKRQKAGRLEWESVATARHNREKHGISEPGLDLLEKYLTKGKNLTALQAERWAGKYFLSVLDDAIKKLASRLGFKSAAELAKAYPKITNKAGLDALMLDIGLENVGFKETRDAEFGSAYGMPPPSKSTPASGASNGTTPSGTQPAAGNGGPGPISGGSSGTTNGTSGTSTPAGATTKTATKTTKAHGAGDPKSVAVALRAFKPRGKNREKLVTLLDELKKLKISDHPHAFCYLLRSMFEISAKAFCKDHQAASGPSTVKSDGSDRSLVDVLRDIVDYLTNNKKDKAKLKELQGAMTQLAKNDSILSVTSMNQLVHNPKFLISAHDICLMFTNVFPLLEEMNK